MFAFIEYSFPNPCKEDSSLILFISNSICYEQSVGQKITPGEMATAWNIKLIGN